MLAVSRDVPVTSRNDANLPPTKMWVSVISTTRTLVELLACGHGSVTATGAA